MKATPMLFSSVVAVARLLQAAAHHIHSRSRAGGGRAFSPAPAVVLRAVAAGALAVMALSFNAPAWGQARYWLDCPDGPGSAQAFAEGDATHNFSCHIRHSGAPRSQDRMIVTFNPHPGYPDEQQATGDVEVRMNENIPVGVDIRVHENQPRPFAPSSSGRQVIIDIVGDDYFEPTERIFLSLGFAPGVTTDSVIADSGHGFPERPGTENDTHQLISISNDDERATYWLECPNGLTESDADFNFSCSIRHSGGAPHPNDRLRASLNPAPGYPPNEQGTPGTAGDFYPSPAMTQTIPQPVNPSNPGGERPLQREGYFPIVFTIVGDNVREEAEKIRISLVFNTRDGQQQQGPGSSILHVDNPTPVGPLVSGGPRPENGAHQIFTIHNDDSGATEYSLVCPDEAVEGTRISCTIDYITPNPLVIPPDGDRLRPSINPPPSSFPGRGTIGADIRWHPAWPGNINPNPDGRITNARQTFSFDVIDDGLIEDDEVVRVSMSIIRGHIESQEASVFLNTLSATLDGPANPNEPENAAHQLITIKDANLAPRINDVGCANDNDMGRFIECDDTSRNPAGGWIVEERGTTEPNPNPPEVLCTLNPSLEICSTITLNHVDYPHLLTLGGRPVETLRPWWSIIHGDTEDADFADRTDPGDADGGATFGPVRLLPNQLEQQFDVRIADDNHVEGDESYTVRVTAIVGDRTVITDTPFVIRGHADPGGYFVSLGGEDGAVREGAGTVVPIVVEGDARTSAHTVNFRIEGVGGANRDDFTVSDPAASSAFRDFSYDAATSAGSITFTPASGRVEVPIPINMTRDFSRDGGAVRVSLTDTSGGGVTGFASSIPRTISIIDARRLVFYRGEVGSRIHLDRECVSSRIQEKVTRTESADHEIAMIVCGTPFSGEPTIHWEIQHITTEPADFTTATSGSFTYRDRMGIVESLSLGIVTDNLNEGTEEFRIRLSIDPSSADAANTDTSDLVTIQITDDDPMRIAIRPPADDVAEGDTATFALDFSGGEPTAPVELRYSLAGVGGDDITAADFSGAGGLTTRTFTVTAANLANPALLLGIADDNQPDTPETFAVTLTGASSAGVVNIAEAPANRAEATIAEAAVRVTPAMLALREGSDSATTDQNVFRVSLVGDPGGSVTVTPSFNPASHDLTLSPAGALTFSAANWASPQPVGISVATDADGDDETVTLTFAVQGYSGVTAANPLTVSIADDDSGADTRPAFAADAAVADQTYTYNEPIAPLALPLATGGNGLLTYSLTPEDAIPAGLSFDPRSRTLSGAPSAGAQTALTYGVIDADGDAAATALTFEVTVPSVIRIVTASRNVPEGNTAEFRVSVAPPLGGEVTLPYSLTPAGLTYGPPADDFDGGLSGQIVLPAGATEGVIEVRVRDDGYPDGNPVGQLESYTLSLGAPSIGTATPNTATLNIGDNHGGLYFIGFEQTTFTFNEGQPFDIGVTLIEPGGDEPWGFTQDAPDPVANPSGIPVPSVAAVVDFYQVPGSARAGVDYRPVGQDIEFLPGLGVRGHRAVGNYEFRPENRRVSVALANIDDCEVDELRRKDFSLHIRYPDQDESREFGFRDFGRSDDRATVVIVDDDEIAIEPSVSVLTILEGAPATYSVALGSCPPAGETVRVESTIEAGDHGLTFAGGAAPTLVFGRDNWSTAQAVNIGSTIDLNIADERALITHSVAVSSGRNEQYDRAANAQVTVNIDDEAPPVPDVTISPRSLDITEGESEIYTIEMLEEPANDTTITPTLGDDHGGSVTLTPPGEQVFTAANWRTVRTVTVGAAEDDDDIEHHVTSIEHRLATAGASGNIQSVAVNVTDDDAPPEAVITPRRLPVLEGDTRAYTVRLRTEPGGMVTVTPNALMREVVTLAPDDALTFTAMTWNVPQSVSVTAEESNFQYSDTETSITHTLSGAGLAAPTAAPSVVVLVGDDDMPPGVSITPQSLAVQQGGGEAVYTVVLDARPTDNADVTVSASNGNAAALSLAPAALTFTALNWDGAQEITVTGGPSVGTTVVDVTHTVENYLGYTATPPAVTVRVFNDTPPAVTITPLSLTVQHSGGEAAYTVVLGARPIDGADVRITPTSANPAALGVSPAVLRFTAANWSAPQRVVVTGGEVSASTNVNVTHTVADYLGYTATPDTVAVRVLGPAGLDSAALDDINNKILPEAVRALVDKQTDAISRRVRRSGAAAHAKIEAPTASLGDAAGLEQFAATHAEKMADGDIDYKRALAGSEFSMPLSAGAAATHAHANWPRATVWGGSDFGRIGGEDQNLRWDGGLFSMQLGIDTRPLLNHPGLASFAGSGNLLAGLLLSYGEADIEDFSYQTGGRVYRGDYNLDLTALNPYLGWSAPDGSVEWWATLGAGKGDVRISPHEQAASNGDVATRTGALGGSREVFLGSVTETRLKGEAFITQISFDGHDKDAVVIPDSNLHTSRYRIALESRQTRKLPGGVQVTPALEVGVRHDAGDARLGSGAEVGGRLHYTDAARGLTLEGRTRALFFHNGDYEDWGIGGSMRLRAGADGQGLSLSLSPAYGNPTDGSVDTRGAGLLQNIATAAEDAGDPLQARLQARIGYGLSDHSDHGIRITPYSEFNLGESKQNYRMGLHWQLAPQVDLDLFAKRSKNKDEAVNHAVLLEGRIRF